MSKKAILAILDGWGLGTDPKVSAIAQANTPFMDSCFQNICKSIDLLNEEVANVVRMDLYKLLGDFVSP